MRSPRTRRASHPRATVGMCSAAPWRSEMAVTRMAPEGSIRAMASRSARPVRAVLFDYGHTLVDFRRTQEALHAAYEQVRARIEAVAYMEVPEILDLLERVARGVEQIVIGSYRQR